MYAIIYYNQGEILPRPFLMDDGSLHIFNTIEEADQSAFALEDLSHDTIDCVVISIAPVNENAQD